MNTNPSVSSAISPQASISGITTFETGGGCRLLTHCAAQSVSAPDDVAQRNLAADKYHPALRTQFKSRGVLGHFGNYPEHRLRVPWECDRVGVPRAFAGNGELGDCWPAGAPWDRR